ncbi:hypothetical protein NC653_018648 [Populus alba x Populus x berolinensis]|uniref:Uncharacterized protein n=1 Tax=Populus alba x Populus x berolinensis TaxID=444605 RepID=A0AAD6QGY8_9ROSI|nr:hypothetical protein NC653_018648 [Populus alba x Populus x berolinensis]
MAGMALICFVQSVVTTSQTAPRCNQLLMSGDPLLSVTACPRMTQGNIKGQAVDFSIPLYQYSLADATDTYPKRLQHPKKDAMKSQRAQPYQTRRNSKFENAAESCHPTSRKQTTNPQLQPENLKMEWEKWARYYIITIKKSIIDAVAPDKKSQGPTLSAHHLGCPYQSNDFLGKTFSFLQLPRLHLFQIISHFVLQCLAILSASPEMDLNEHEWCDSHQFWQLESSLMVADVWSCGVTVHAILVGSYPVEDPDEPKDFGKTIQSPNGSCCYLLNSQMITIPEIRNHEWFLKNLPTDLEDEKTMGSHFEESDQPMVLVDECWTIWTWT